MKNYISLSFLGHLLLFLVIFLLLYLFTPKTVKQTLTISVVQEKKGFVKQQSPQISTAPNNTPTQKPEPSTLFPTVKKTMPTVSTKDSIKDTNIIKGITKPSTSTIPQAELPPKTVENNVIEAPPQEDKSPNLTSPTIVETPKEDKEVTKPFISPEETLKESDDKQASKHTVPQDITRFEAPILTEGVLKEGQKTQEEKALDFSKFKDESFTSLLDNANKEEAIDIMAEESLLSDDEKRAFIKQVSGCWVNLGVIREKEIVIKLQLKMNEDATIDNIFIIQSDNSLTPQERIEIENKIINLFKRPNCKTLILPKDKFFFWQEFTLKMNIKGFFD